jgi:H+/gluconate symporter-like permease
MNQQNILFQSILDKGDEGSNKKKSLEFLDFRRYELSLIAFFIFIFLLFSIFISMANIAKNSKFLPTDTYATFSFLIGPLLYLMIAVILLMFAFVILPMRPPLEKNEDKS